MANKDEDPICQQSTATVRSTQTKFHINENVSSIVHLIAKGAIQTFCENYFK